LTYKAAFPIVIPYKKMLSAAPRLSLMIISQLSGVGFPRDRIGFTRYDRNHLYHDTNSTTCRPTPVAYAFFYPSSLYQQESLTVTSKRIALGLLVPAVTLVIARLLVPLLSELPPSLTGIRIYGVHFVLGLGLVLSLAFRRGRIVLALLMLATAYLCYTLLLQKGLAGFPPRTVFVALSVFLPFNFAVLSLIAERGMFNVYGAQRLVTIALEAAFTWWIVLANETEITAWAYAPLYNTKLFAELPIPQIGLTIIALSLVICLAVWYIKRSPLDLGLGAAVLAFGIGMNGISTPDLFPVFIMTAGLMLIVAMLQTTYGMAFRDELTGLPSRRALNESMMKLGRYYTIAMIDVDHFKNFNDTYGHDLGDQVLKIVARKIAKAGGGSKPYRYGGEEFTILFPGKYINDAIPHLEALRKAIAHYKMALRASNRPTQPNSANRTRGAFRAAKSVSVTISIGVAERTEKLATPDAVVKAADIALYRAKKMGRNQVRK
jgi:diguanylate cyclase (GGDEF)-like protein